MDKAPYELYVEIFGYLIIDTIYDKTYSEVRRINKNSLKATRTMEKMTLHKYNEYFKDTEKIENIEAYKKMLNEWFCLYFYIDEFHLSQYRFMGHEGTDEELIEVIRKDKSAFGRTHLFGLQNMYFRLRSVSLFEYYGVYSDRMVYPKEMLQNEKNFLLAIDQSPKVYQEADPKIRKKIKTSPEFAVKVFLRNPIVIEWECMKNYRDVKEVCQAAIIKNWELKDYFSVDLMHDAFPKGTQHPQGIPTDEKLLYQYVLDGVNKKIMDMTVD